MRALSIIVVIAVLATSCSTGDEPAEAGSEGVANESTDTSGTVLFSDDHAEFRLSGSAARPIEVEAVPTSQVADLPGEVTLVGDVVYTVDQSPVTPMDEPIQMTFFTGDDGEEYILAHLTKSGTWEFYPVRSAEGAITWHTNDFFGYNILSGGRAVWDKWIYPAATEAGDWAFDAILGTTDPPENCSFNALASDPWITTTGSPANGLVHFCIRDRDDDLVEVVIASNSDSPVMVTVGNKSAVEWVWTGDSADWSVGVMSFVLGSDHTYYLGPGRTMTIGYRRPPNGVGVAHDFLFTQDQTAQVLGLVGEYLGSFSQDLVALMLLVCMIEAAWPEMEGIDALLAMLNRCVKDKLIEKGFEDLIRTGVDTALNRMLDASTSERASSFWLQNVEWLNQIDGALEKHRHWTSGVFTSGLAVKLLADSSEGLALALKSWTPVNAQSSVFLDGWCSAAGIPLTRTVVTATALRSSADDESTPIADLRPEDALLVFPEQATPNPEWTMAMRPTDTECGFVKLADLMTPTPKSDNAWDLIKGAEIPALCGHEPTRLVDGVHEGLAQNQGFFMLGDDLVTGLESQLGPLIVSVADCSAGGGGWEPLYVFFDSEGRYVSSTSLWDLDYESVGLRGPGRCCAEELSVDGDELTIRYAALQGPDDLCCPTGTAQVTLRVSGDGSIVPVDLKNLGSGGADENGQTVDGADCGPLTVSRDNTYFIEIESGMDCRSSLRVLTRYLTDSRLDRQGSGAHASFDGWDCQIEPPQGFANCSSAEGTVAGWWGEAALSRGLTDVGPSFDYEPGDPSVLATEPGLQYDVGQIVDLDHHAGWWIIGVDRHQTPDGLSGADFKEKPLLWTGATDAYYINNNPKIRHYSVPPTARVQMVDSEHFEAMCEDLSIPVVFVSVGLEEFWAEVDHPFVVLTFDEFGAVVSIEDSRGC